MSWVKLGGHACVKPKDWTNYDHGAVWRCPGCGQQYIVWGPKGGSRQFSRRMSLLNRVVFNDDGPA